MTAPAAADAHPATHWLQVILLWACGVVAGMQFAKISLAFQVLQGQLGVGPASMGLVLSTVGSVGLVFGVTMGLLAPAIGYRRLLLGGLGLGAMLSALQSTGLPFAWLLASRVLEGASHLAVVVAAPILITQRCHPRQRAVAMGLWSTFVGVAFALTGALGPAAMARGGVHGLLLAHATAMALAGTLAWRMLDGTPDASPGEPAPHWRTLVRRHGEVYASFITALPGLCFVCYTLLAVALLTFVPSWSGTDRGWLLVVLPLMVIAGNFSAGWLVQHWLAPLQLVRGAFLLVAFSALLMGASHQGGVRIAPAALALLYSAGLAGGAAYALIPYLCHAAADQARANGAVAQLGNLGSTSGPPLMAALIGSWGLAGVVLPVLAAALAGLGLASWAVRHHARRSAAAPARPRAQGPPR